MTSSGTSTSAPVALISRSALAHNARLVMRTHGVVDVRRDAWGHGADVVAAVASEVGLPCVVDARDEHLFAEARYETYPSLDSDSRTLYGLPGGAEDAVPVMSLQGRVLSTKALRAGEGVSYGYLYRAPADTQIALVTGGYAQGIIRSLGGQVDVHIAGSRRPIIGRVAMDVCVIELGSLTVARDDMVVFFGDSAFGYPALDRWSTASGLDAAELASTVGRQSWREVAP